MAASLRVDSSRNSAGTPLAIRRSGWLSRTSLRYWALTSASVASGLRRSDVVGAAVVRDEAGAEEAELAVGEAETGGDGLEELVLLGMQHAVGSRHVHEALEHVLQKLAVVLEQGRDLAGVGLVAGHVLLGQIEHVLDVGGLLGRKAEDLGEGVVLQRRDHAVGLGHLGAERDDGDREGNVFLRLAAVALEAECAGEPAQQVSACVADSRRQARYLLPNRHERMLVPRMPAGSDCAAAIRWLIPSSARLSREHPCKYRQLTRS